MKARRALDASAMLALIQNEVGAEEMARAMDDGSELFISAVNLCEVISKLVRDGASEAQVAIGLEPFLGYVTSFDSAQASRAAFLYKETRSLGLSLGDRACLALALTKGATVLTTDRAWKKLKIGVQVDVLR